MFQPESAARALAPVLMVQGTASSVGKSTLVAGLCRLYARRGLRVAPFKAQNMSNNAAVCPGGGEIGRAQYAQAVAARIVPTIDMNPILLKPQPDGCQVVVRGKAALLSPAPELLEQRTGLPALGIVPYLDNLTLAEEDAASLTEHSAGSSVVEIAVVRFPHIANFDEFGPLTAEPGVQVRYVT